MKWFHKLLLINAGMDYDDSFLRAFTNGIPGQGMAKVLCGFYNMVHNSTQPLIFQIVNGQFSSERLLHGCCRGLQVCGGRFINIINI
jgi:hypothetical protein